MRITTLALIGLVAVTGCKKDDEAEPEVASVTLTVGSAVITVSSTGVVSGGPITVVRPNQPSIVASFRRADGAEDPYAHGGAFQLNVTSANTGVLTFARTTGSFAGLLNGVSAGSTTIAVSLFHIAAMHDDFGPFNVPVTVQ